MDCRDCPNTKCYINTNCLGSWLEFVEKFKTRKLISRGLTVFSEGDLVTGIYVVCSGKLKITMKTTKSNESIIRLAGDGQVLGHRGISENMLYPISAETLADSELAYIPNEEFFKLIRHNIDLSFFMMMFFADELMRSERKFRLRTLTSDKEKLATSLCLILDAFGYKEDDKNKVDLAIDLNELSNFAEISKSNLRNSIAHLSDLMLIEWIEDEIIIKDEPALRRLAHFE